MSETLDTRLLPSDLAAEAALLASMMLDAPCIDRVVSIVDCPEDFWTPAHGIIFAALADMHDRGKPIDLVLTKEELKRRGQLEEVGGLDYLLKLVESVPSAANALHYAQVVKQRAIRRALIAVSDETREAAYDDQADADETLRKAEAGILDIADRQYSGQMRSLEEIVKPIAERLASPGAELEGIRTGYERLDDKLAGLHAGEFIVLASRPSVGKTALLLNVAYHAAKAGEKVLLFSLEMTADEIGKRLLSLAGGIDAHNVRRFQPTTSELRQIGLTAGDLYLLNFHVDDTARLSPLQLRAKARRAQRQYGITLILVDYLQLMVDPQRRSRKRWEEVAEISHSLKALAKELHVPVLCAAQLNREADTTGSARPRLSQLRESGDLEQDADVVLLLYRHDYQKEHQENPPEPLTEVIIAKQRNGPTGVVKLMFDKAHGLFAALSPVHPQFPPRIARPPDDGD